MSLLCPLMSNNIDNIHCYKENCAWWNPNEQKCVILTIGLKK
jgi:hypothetical protein